MDKFHTYLKSAMRLESYRRSKEMVDMQVAVGSLLAEKNHKAFMKYLEKLTRKD